MPVNRPLLTLALLCIGLLFVLCLPSESLAGNTHGKQLTIYDGRVAHVRGPWGDSWNHDSNGDVPMYADNSTRKLAYASVGGRGKGEILYNEQKMRGASPCTWDALIRHEKAHVQGYSHGEGRPPDGDGKREKDENRAYFSHVRPCHYPATAKNNYANKY
jgi:hypothetical protein